MIIPITADSSLLSPKGGVKRIPPDTAIHEQMATQSYFNAQCSLSVSLLRLLLLAVPIPLPFLMTDGDSMTINNLRDSAKGTFVTLDDYLLLTSLSRLFGFVLL